MPSDSFLYLWDLSEMSSRTEGGTKSNDEELLAAIEDMWILGIHPPASQQPVADLLRISGRDDLINQVHNMFCFGLSVVVDEQS